MATELDQDLVLLAGVVHSATPLALCQAIYMGESESWPNAIKKLMAILGPSKEIAPTILHSTENTRLCHSAATVLPKLLGGPCHSVAMAGF